MGLFQNRSMQNVSYRTQLEMKYRTARANLLLIIAFTLVNIVIILFGGSTYFLFSASVPYYLVTQGAVFCGRFPEEFYTKIGWEGDFYPTTYLAVMCVIAAIILAVYLLCWIFSKKRPAWMTVALVLFSADTLGMFYLYGFDMSIIVDIIFHAWVLMYLIIGVVANHKLKNLPEDEPQAESQGNGFSDVYNSTFNAQPSAPKSDDDEDSMQNSDSKSDNNEN